MRKLFSCLLCLFLAGCALGNASTPTLPQPTAAFTPTAMAEPLATPPAPMATRQPTPTPPPPTATPAPLRLWLDPALPAALQSALHGLLKGQSVVTTTVATQADVRIGFQAEAPLARWVYAAVVPFPTLADEISWQEVQRFWAGQAGALRALSGDATSPTLYLTEETLAALRAVWGAPSPQAPIVTLPAEELVERAWAARPHAWSIVPFDALVPKWKVLRLDGQNILDKALDLAGYPLAFTVGAAGPGAPALKALMPPAKPLTNRDTGQMTVLIMTGVTALVRATAYEMEQRGILYPAAKIGEVLRSADLTHISNEVPFAQNCPPPDRAQETLVFCSDPRYIELLRAVGTDIVELTGNHFQDYGSQATLDTLKMYRQEGWPYYGGGANLEEARRPLVVEDHGNQLAFIGCNPVGPEYAWATEDRPGAAPCDLAYMHGQIRQLRQEGMLPIATWQYWEFYFYEPTPQQQADFRAMVDAGAVIVSGSQAHHPQALEFYKDGFIHYGLGNLFFDQMQSLETRQCVVDRHVIYQGRHLSTELLTYLIEDFCQPRPMTATERQDLLQKLFAASGW
jgi:hypothetical protein